MSKTNLHPIPITSQNELPHIRLSVGLGNSNIIICVSFLYDTGAALDTGFLHCHLQIMKKYPKIVARFEKLMEIILLVRSSYVVQ